MQSRARSAVIHVYRGGWKELIKHHANVNYQKFADSANLVIGASTLTGLEACDSSLLVNC